MSRKLSKKALRFARMWGEVKALSDDEWNALVELRTALTEDASAGPKKREPRKPRVRPVEEGG